MPEAPQGVQGPGTPPKTSLEVQVGWGMQQPGLEEGVPAHGNGTFNSPPKTLPRFPLSDPSSVFHRLQGEPVPAEGAAVPQPGTYSAGGCAGCVLPAAPDIFPAPGSVPERHPAPLLRPGAAPGLPGTALLLQVPHAGNWGSWHGSCQVGLGRIHPCLCLFHSTDPY